ncbi:hypothetical protein MLD38_004927 [Melastoma candidum]|uniref:Uncharacterized protein n=1 Tax=Melastoma candidum TaxID=119954 RepID=A0ACB9SAJ5_9MYRT|nr:hypothetical protein MLD38_004927 [Melastoma candidum]
MDTSAALSQGSISLISTSNYVVNPHGINSGASEFVNHGLLLWNQTRQQWIGNKKAASWRPELSASKPSWNATHESLLGCNKLSARRIPLSEMVEFLVDIWEQEGMYD